MEKQERNKRSPLNDATYRSDTTYDDDDDEREKSIEKLAKKQDEHAISAFSSAASLSRSIVQGLSFSK